MSNQSTRFIPNWRMLWHFLHNPKTDWKPKAVAALAMLYIVWPIDLIPDFAPILGWLDDIGVGALAIGYLVYATRAYSDLHNSETEAEKIDNQLKS